MPVQDHFDPAQHALDKMRELHGITTGGLTQPRHVPNESPRRTARSSGHPVAGKSWVVAAFLVSFWLFIRKKKGPAVTVAKIAMVLLLIAVLALQFEFVTVLLAWTIKVLAFLVALVVVGAIVFIVAGCDQADSRVPQKSSSGR